MDYFDRLDAAIEYNAPESGKLSGTEHETKNT